MIPQVPRRLAPGPTAAAVALTVRASPQGPWQAAQGPTAATTLTVRAPPPINIDIIEPPKYQ